MKFCLFIALLVISVLVAVEPLKVQACSYGGDFPTLEEILISANTVVRGRFVESDEARQNYILQVDSYLRGEPGQEFLFVSFNDPMTIQGLIDTTLGGGDCNSFYDPVPLHKPGYFVLGYADELGVHHEGNILTVFLFDEFFPLRIHDEVSNLNVFYDRPEFENFILRARGNKAQEPLPDSRYPSTAPLLITTEDGTEYILPVNGKTALPITDRIRQKYIPVVYNHNGEKSSCITWDCAIWSADGRTLILKSDDEFVYRQQRPQYYFKADSFLLSPIAMAVWKDDRLSIHLIHSTLHYATSYEEIGYEIGQVKLDFDEVSNAENSVWSPDGRILAYSDAQGLWLWDVFASEPRLLLPANKHIPIAKAFSGRNRYLSIFHGEEKFILDLFSENRLPFGYISPDEMVMVNCAPDESHEGSCVLQLYQLAPYRALPGWSIFVKDELEVEWAHNHRVLVKTCNQLTGICGIINSDNYLNELTGHVANSYNIGMSRPKLKPALDFVVQGRNVAILIDNDTIEINYEKLDFDLGSPIVEMRWLPQLFYGEAPYPPQTDWVRVDEE